MMKTPLEKALQAVNTNYSTINQRGLVRTQTFPGDSKHIIQAGLEWAIVQLAALQSPWAYLIDAEGNDTGERTEDSMYYLVSVMHEHNQMPVEYYTTASFYNRHEKHWHDLITDHKIDGEVYAFQPWPDPAPFPGSGE